MNDFKILAALSHSLSIVVGQNASEPSLFVRLLMGFPALTLHLWKRSPHVLPVLPPLLPPTELCECPLPDEAPLEGRFGESGGRAWYCCCCCCWSGDGPVGAGPSWP